MFNEFFRTYSLQISCEEERSRVLTCHAGQAVAIDVFEIKIKIDELAFTAAEEGNQYEGKKLQDAQRPTVYEREVYSWCSAVEDIKVCYGRR